MALLWGGGASLRGKERWSITTALHIDQERELIRLARTASLDLSGALPAVETDGEIISSTLIRGTVEKGDLARAARMLGREFTILGTVVEGDRVGRKLGFPTANLSAHNEQFPPNGVYAVEARRGDRMLPGVANIGVRPTVKKAGGERLLEVHLFDFHEEIYG